MRVLGIVAGAFLLLGSVGAMAYSIFAWMLPGKNVGFLDHIVLAVGTPTIIVGLWLLSANLRKPKR